MYPSILALDQTGRPARWASWEDAIVYKVKGLISWHLGEDFVFHGGTSRLTGEQSVITVPSIIAVRNQVYSGRVALTNHNLFARDGQICAYCGNKFLKSQLTREHIVPVSKNGPNTWTNCVTACASCNGAKGHMSLEQAEKELGFKLLYVPYEPNTAEALVMSGRNILFDQMQFLKECLPKHSRLHARLS